MNILHHGQTIRDAIKSKEQLKVYLKFALKTENLNLLGISIFDAFPQIDGCENVVTSNRMQSQLICFDIFAVKVNVCAIVRFVTFDHSQKSQTSRALF